MSAHVTASALLKKASFLRSTHQTNTASLLEAAAARIEDLQELVSAMQADYQDILASGRPTGSSDRLMERAQALLDKDRP